MRFKESRYSWATISTLDIARVIVLVISGMTVEQLSQGAFAAALSDFEAHLACPYWYIFTEFMPRYLVLAVEL